ncbi:MAG: 4Fe-4S binding protein [Deltaproteobacteria bacterium]|jgi:polyferredoxin|nr:4Fe-4S binding protein [Deltaproteobacteria bacterium]
MIGVKTLRLWAQHICFVVLTFGGRLGVNLGYTLPCLSCPFVNGCGGVCYLRMLQSPNGGFGLTWLTLWSERGLMGLLALIMFVFLTALFGNSWCGWVCPFGLLQDYISKLRNWLKIREAIFTPKTLKYLRILKYAIFGYVILTPIMVTAGWVHPDLTMPFCGICPVRVIMPLLIGDTSNLALDFTNIVLLSISSILIIFTGVTLIGAFFKERFFCLICPMNVLINFVRPLYLLNLVKDPRACLGCCTCRQVCPGHLNTADLERSGAEKLEKKKRIFALGRPIPIKLSGCHGCFDCVETCATDGSLGVKFGPWILTRSSRARSVASWPGPAKKPPLEPNAPPSPTDSLAR